MSNLEDLVKAYLTIRVEREKILHEYEEQDNNISNHDLVEGKLWIKKEIKVSPNLQNNLDWIHLDTESIDDEIIMSLDFTKINKPKLIVFETINFSEERTKSRLRIDTLFNWLQINGYKTKYDYWNSFAYLS